MAQEPLSGRDRHALIDQTRGQRLAYGLSATSPDAPEPVALDGWGNLYVAD